MTIIAYMHSTAMHVMATSIVALAPPIHCSTGDAVGSAGVVYGTTSAGRRRRRLHRAPLTISSIADSVEYWRRPSYRACSARMASSIWLADDVHACSHGRTKLLATSIAALLHGVVNTRSTYMYWRRRLQYQYRRRLHHCLLHH
jgi:hypothetical protein